MLPQKIIKNPIQIHQPPSMQAAGLVVNKEEARLNNNNYLVYKLQLQLKLKNKASDISFID